MLDAERNLQHHAYRPLHHRRVGSVLRLRPPDGADQQLRQPVHLRCQVPRVPDRRQTNAARAGRTLSLTERYAVNTRGDSRDDDRFMYSLHYWMPINGQRHRSTVVL